MSSTPPALIKFREFATRLNVMIHEALDVAPPALPTMHEAVVLQHKATVLMAKVAANDKAMSAAQRRELVVEVRRVARESQTYIGYVGERLGIDPAPTIEAFSSTLDGLADFEPKAKRVFRR